MTNKVDRRQFIATGAAAAALPLFTIEAQAQAYPSKPIRIVVGYPAGGQTDIIARTYGEYMSRQLGQPVVVENKAGAGGIIGAVEVKRAPPDGYTLMVTISTTMIQNRVTVKNLPYDADKDFVLPSLMTQIGLVMVASQKTGASNLKEFVEYAKKTDKVSMGTLCGGLDRAPDHRRAQQAVWAEHRGGALSRRGADVGRHQRPVARCGGRQLQRGAAGAAGRPRQGRGRDRACSACPLLPDVPTMVEQGANSKLYELRGFTCFAAPAGTPPDIIKKLSDTIVAGRERPEGEGDDEPVLPQPADPARRGAEAVRRADAAVGAVHGGGGDQAGVRGTAHRAMAAHVDAPSPLAGEGMLASVRTDAG